MDNTLHVHGEGFNLQARGLEYFKTDPYDRRRKVKDHNETIRVLGVCVNALNAAVKLPENAWLHSIFAESPSGVFEVLKMESEDRYQTKVIHEIHIIPSNGRDDVAEPYLRVLVTEYDRPFKSFATILDCSMTNSCSPNRVYKASW